MDNKVFDRVEKKYLITKSDKKELLKVLDTLHKKKDFQKIQEVLGDEIEDGLRILEENHEKKRS